MLKSSLRPDDGLHPSAYPPLGIYFSHPFTHAGDREILHNKLRSGWGDCWCPLEPSRAHPLHTGSDQELKQRLTSLVRASDVVLVSGRPTPEWRRPWMRLELDTASKAQIPILEVVVTEADSGSGWIGYYASEYCLLNEVLSFILSVLPEKRKNQFRQILLERYFSHAQATFTRVAASGRSAPNAR